jgi:ABC-type enterobactin transport system permease subunit
LEKTDQACHLTVLTKACCVWLRLAAAVNAAAGVAASAAPTNFTAATAPHLRLALLHQFGEGLEDGLVHSIWKKQQHMRKESVYG